MLALIPVTLAAANAFVAQHHRHHKPVIGHKYSIGCSVNDTLVGVIIVGRHTDCMAYLKKVGAL